LTQRSFYIEKSLYKGKGDLNTEHRHVYTQEVLQIEALSARRNFSTEQLAHTEAFTQKNLYTKNFLHTGTFTQGNFYIGKLLHTENFTYRTPSLTQRSFYAQTRLHREAFTQDFLHTEAFYVQNYVYKVAFDRQKVLQTDNFTAH